MTAEQTTATIWANAHNPEPHHYPDPDYDPVSDNPWLESLAEERRDHGRWGGTGADADMAADRDERMEDLRWA